MINANIYDNKLFVENSTVSDSVKFDTVKFTFPDNWRGYTKTALFKTENGETIKVVLDAANPLCLNENECYIPYEVIKSPCFYLSVFGVLGESVATTTQVRVPVLQSGYAEGEEPLEPTPTEYQQIINLTTQTKEIAESIRNDADNGLFKGEKGDKGDQGVQGEKGEKGEKGDTGEVTYEYANNTFASAITNRMIGNVIKVCDVSEIEHDLTIKLSSESITDFSDVTVTQCGKNLIQYPYIESSKTQNGVTYTDIGDGSIMISGSATNYTDFFINTIEINKNTQYCYNGFADSENIVAQVILKDVNQNTITTISANPLYQSQKVIVFNTDIYPTAVTAALLIKRGDNATVSGVIKPQLEVGLTATEYEPYKKLQTVKANADGVVEGLKSISPNMTFLTNTDSIDIDLTYNVDTKMYIDNKLNSLL